MNLNEIEEQKLLDGVFVKFIHSETMTVAYWRFEAGAVIPEHTHHHEQIVNMMEGEFELTVNGHPHKLTPGEVVILPPDISHGGKALTDSRLIDVFHPVRDDYR